MNRLIPILIALLVGMSSCSDSNDTPDPDVPTPGALNRYLCLNVAVAGNRVLKTAQRLERMKDMIQNIRSETTKTW